jgi:hypothetical protein
MKISKLKTPFGEILISDCGSTGAACMMLHGNSQSSEQFDEQFIALREKHRLINLNFKEPGAIKSLFFA